MGVSIKIVSIIVFDIIIVFATIIIAKKILKKGGKNEKTKTRKSA